MPSPFADISSWQGAVSIEAYTASGPDRLMIKATQGTSYVNPYFAAQWHSAGAYGLRRGVYHYATPSRSTGFNEAAFFVATLQRIGGFDPARDWVCLDVEDTGLGPSTEWWRARAHAVEFCTAMAQYGYPRGAIYSGRWYLEPARLQASYLPEEWRHLHISLYDSTPDDQVVLPPGWSRQMVVARQFTSTGSHRGITGDVDSNRVVNEWLEIGDFEDMNADELKQIFRDVLNEGTGPGQSAWQGTSRETLRLAQEDFNQNAVATAAIGELAKSIGLVGLSTAEVRAWVEAINDAVQAIQAALSRLPDTAPPGPSVQIDYRALASAFVVELLRTLPATTTDFREAMDVPEPPVSTTEAFGRTWVDEYPPGFDQNPTEYTNERITYMDTAPPEAAARRRDVVDEVPPAPDPSTTQEIDSFTGSPPGSYEVPPDPHGRHGSNYEPS